MSNYDKVLAAVKQIYFESDGPEWKALLSDRNKLQEKIAGRLTEILFTCVCGKPVVPSCDNPECERYS